MMPTNPDIALLAAQRIDPRDPRPPLVQALRIGLYDELRARTFYGLVVDRFGPIAPFVNIRDSEIRHIQALSGLCQRYGIVPPVDDWPGRLSIPATPAECCAIGVRGEIANGAMYDRFLSWPMPADAAAVFASLRGASWNNHLAAFRRCAGDLAMPAQRGGWRLAALAGLALVAWHWWPGGRERLD